MSYPANRLSRAHKRIRRATGTNMVLNSTAWVELAAATNGPGAGNFDIVLQAEVGDQIEYGLSAIFENQSPDVYLDIMTLAGGNYFSGLTGAGHAGIPGWQQLGGTYSYFSSTLLGPDIVGTDLLNGYVTLRPMYRMSAAVNRTMRTDATMPFFIWAKNIGPVDPN